MLGTTASLRPRMSRIPAGSLQAENGFLDTYNQGQNVVDGSETLVRFGIFTKNRIAFRGAGLFLQREQRRRPRFGVRRLGHRRQTAAWAHARRIRRVCDVFPQSSDGRVWRVERRVRPGIAGGPVAPVVLQVDSSGNARYVVAHTGTVAISHRSGHDSFGSAADGALGCFRRVRGQLSCQGRDAPVYPLRIST